MTSNAPGYGRVDRDYGMRLATMPPDEDGPVWMVNLMKYREVAAYADGGGGAGRTAISGKEADDLYTPLESLAGVGAEIVFGGDVDQQLLGDAPIWDRVGVVKYPTRRSFIEMQSRPDFQRQHVHKEAGMQETIVIGCQPIATPTAPDGVQPVDWADVPHPPTDEDGPVMVIHVLKYHDAARASITPENMAAYQRAAGEVAMPHGVRISGWFAAEGTILGDGRTWDQVRFNLFPSKAAFMAVVMDPARLEAQRTSREPAIADTYTMIVRPTIDRIAESIGD
ncbi:MAG: hypothetical protein WBL31_08045 [Ilumatobacteraceae bacterium]